MSAKDIRFLSKLSEDAAVTLATGSLPSPPQPAGAS